MTRPLLEVSELEVIFRTQEQKVHALGKVDLSLEIGDTVALMGESGCGKSVLAHAIMRLLEDVAEVKGSVSFEGKDLYNADKETLSQVIGKKISLVPQNPLGSFNPVMKIGHHIDESLINSGLTGKRGARERTEAWLRKVGFEQPSEIYNTYAHRLSGGMCERGLIALAACIHPVLLIADEPTKGLDGFSKKRVLDVLHGIRGGAAMIMITHEFKVAMTCSNVAIMYAGEIVESGPAKEVLGFPIHPYTFGLRNAQPRMGMIPIAGRYRVEDAREPGCRFRARCPLADQDCVTHPCLMARGDGRMVRCHHA